MKILKIALLVSLGILFGCQTKSHRYFVIDTNPEDNSKLIETDPVETDSVETDSVETDPVGTDPVGTDLVDTSTEAWLQCENWDPDTETYVYNNYPPGPYGFKGSVCWSQ